MTAIIHRCKNLLLFQIWWNSEDWWGKTPILSKLLWRLSLHKIQNGASIAPKSSYYHIYDVAHVLKHSWMQSVSNEYKNWGRSGFTVLILVTMGTQNNSCVGEITYIDNQKWPREYRHADRAFGIHYYETWKQWIHRGEINWWKVVRHVAIFATMPIRILWHVPYHSNGPALLNQNLPNELKRILIKWACEFPAFGTAVGLCTRNARLRGFLLQCSELLLQIQQYSMSM